MSETSVRLALPYLQPSQAQKHVTHNEALQRLDLLVQLVVESFDTAVPPSLPEEGQVWALGATPGGDWAGQANTLAAWASGGWIHVTPQEGWRAFGRADGSFRLWNGTGWVAPLDAQVQTQLGVNTTADAQNRLAVSSPAALFTHEGAGHQLKINKAGATDTASLLFQTGFSGRAEMGTAGDDDFSVKVSADGSSWANALIAAGATGQVTLPNGLVVQGSLTLPNASVPRAALANSTALSVVGRASNTVGVPADIAAGSDHQVLRRSGASIGFGALDLAQAAAVTGALPVANGGTGGTTQAAARTGLGLGTAATATVTTSATDTTAGRLLKVADFGLGSKLLNTGATVLTNVDDATLATGFYAARNTTTGDNPGPFGIVLIAAYTASGQAGTSQVTQEYWPTSATPIKYIRHYRDGTWSTWRQLYHAGSILGTVGQSGGVPTGAVMESGSNANGSYVRLANGWQVCTSPVFLADATTAVGSMWKWAANQTWTFPAAFSAVPNASPASTNNTSLLGACASTTTTATTVNVLNAVSAAGRTATFIAIGPWF